jgi:hypothetical protein
MRWARALAIAGTYLLALQSLGLPRFAAENDATCCCHYHGEACHCPICSHVRARESGKPLLTTCPGEQPTATVVTLDLSLPAVAPERAPRIAQELPRPPPPDLHEDPPQEVPTPPPLA